MNAPILTKSWTITPNLSRTFVSLIDTAGWFAFENLTALLANGWSMKWSTANGTGPTGAGDNTDRITNAAAFATRATVAAAAQSYFVITNVDGVQILVAYQGATDDVIRIAYSPSGAYALAGTTTNQPTASDEVVISAGNTVVNATASANRTMSIWCGDSSRHWRCVVFRQSAITVALTIEKCISLCESGVLSPNYFGSRYTTASRSSAAGTPIGGVSSTAVGSAGWLGAAARVTTAATSRIVRVGGGEVVVSAGPGAAVTIGSTFITDKPALQNNTGSPVLPLYWSGERTTNFDGFFGSPIDWWQMPTSALTTPALVDNTPGYDVGDTPGVTGTRSNWFVAIGSAMLWPWRNAAASLVIT